MPPNNEKIELMEITDFSGGLNTRQEVRSIAVNESPLQLNTNITDEGAVITRFGYEEVCTLPTGTKTLGIIPYKKVTDSSLTQKWDVYKTSQKITLAVSPTIAVSDTLTPTSSVLTLTGTPCSYVGTVSVLQSSANSTKLAFATIDTTAKIIKLYFTRPLALNSFDTSQITWSSGHGLAGASETHNSERTIYTIEYDTGTTVTTGDTITSFGSIKDINNNSIGTNAVSLGTPFTDPRILSVFWFGVSGSPALGDIVEILWTDPMDTSTLPSASLPTDLGLSGGHNFGTDTPSFDRLVIFADDGSMYYITKDEYTPVLIGSWISYGMTPTETVRGSVLNDILIFGNGTAVPLLYNGVTISQISSYSIKAKNNIFSVWGATGASTAGGSKVYAAGNPTAKTTLYYSSFANPNDWATSGGSSAVSLNDGESITGIMPLDDSLVIFKEDHTFIGKQYVDSSGETVPTIQISPNRLSAGCVAPSSIALSGNDIIRLADPDTYGISALGFQESYFTQNQRNNSLSWKIQPTVRNINRANMHKATGAYWQDRYILCAPTSSSSENNTCFVYSTTIDGRGYWTLWNDVNANSMAIFEDSNSRNVLHFGSNLEPKVYKFNAQFTDGDAGYRRIYRTKVFGLGDFKRVKRFHRFYIRGAINSSTSLTMRMVVDGVASEYTINSDYFEYDTAGNAMGDNVYGDELFGGDDVVSLTRFMYRDEPTISIAEGREVYFEFENTGAGQAWKIDYIGLEYAYDTEENYPMTLTSS